MTGDSTRQKRGTGGARRAEHRVSWAPARRAVGLRSVPVLGQSSAGQGTPAALVLAGEGGSCIGAVHACCPSSPAILKDDVPRVPFREVPPTVPILFSLSLPQARRPDSGQDEAQGGQGLFGVTATPVALCTLQRPGKGGPPATKRSLSRACIWCLATVCVAGDVPVQER